MDSIMLSEGRSTVAGAIAGERRQDKRYELRMGVKWKLIRRKRVLDTGTGQTIDLSSGGILFDAGRHLPEGLDVELSITWPALLHNVSPMQLVALGRIVRSGVRNVAFATSQHEFRTVGVTGGCQPHGVDSHQPGGIYNAPQAGPSR